MTLSLIHYFSSLSLESQDNESVTIPSPCKQLPRKKTRSASVYRWAHVIIGPSVEVSSWQSHEQSNSCHNLLQDGINIWVGWRSGVQEECHQGQWKRFRWGIFRCVKLHNINSPQFQPPPLAISLDRQHQQQSGGWETRSSMEMTSPMSGSQRNLCQVHCQA